MATTPLAGYPNATNTGVPDGTTLTPSGALRITTNGAVINALDIRGDVIIDADNVTIQNSSITSSSFHAIRVMDGATGFTLKDSTINGLNSAHNGIFGNGTFLRNDISGVENAIAPTANTLIQGNYIHDLGGDSSSHVDGIEINYGNNIQIIHNSVIVDNSTVSAIMLNNWGGGLSNILVDDNFLAGGGFTVYLDGRFGGGPVDDASIRITNNEIVKGQYGYFSFYDDNPVQTGNTLYATPPTSTGGGSTGGGTGSGGGTGTTGMTGTSGDDALPLGGLSMTGSQTLRGLDGNDVLRGGAGADTLDGGNGSDTASYAGSSAGVTVNLQTGQALNGDAQGDRFVSIENLTGSSYADRLTGNGSANVLNGGSGADVMRGGAGNDTYVVDSTGDTVDESISGSGGIDTVHSSVSFSLVTSTRVLGTLESLTLTGSGDINGVGNVWNNWITGNSGANTLHGGGGDDTLIGGAGIDSLDGGTGNDTMQGGAGNDIYVVDSARDIVDESASGSNGADTVFSSVSFSLATSARVLGTVETLSLMGSSNINATGNAADNGLVGNSGANTLSGGGGNDLLIGGAGLDTLTGGSGNDYFVFNTPLSSANRDTIVDFNPAADTVLLDNDVMTALGASTGALRAGAFYAGSAAHDADDRIVYNQSTGALYYDSNGSSAGGVVQLATLTNRPTVTASDFAVI